MGLSFKDGQTLIGPATLITESQRGVIYLSYLILPFHGLANSRT